VFCLKASDELSNSPLFLSINPCIATGANPNGADTYFPIILVFIVKLPILINTLGARKIFLKPSILFLKVISSSLPEEK